MAGAGTGSPIWFRCWRDRQTGRRFTTHTRETRIKLTGRTRPYRPGKGHAPGSRSVFTAYEYECDCGYVGWSNHVDLARMANDTEALQRRGMHL